MLAKIKAVLSAVADFIRHTEPVAVAHAVAAVVALVVSVKAGHLDYGLVAAAWLAIQGLLVRSAVTPTPKDGP